MNHLASSGIHNGIIAVYKPRGVSSFAVVRALQRATGVKKIGHAGTLDPFASGVLVVGIGREATKQLHRIVESEKEYILTVKLGEESNTGDPEGTIRIVPVLKAPTRVAIRSALKKYTGVILQTPPQFSAVKVKGKRAYEYARLGEKVVLKSRPVFIKTIRILSYRYPLLKLKVVCGKGVYMRSLAQDIGRDVGTGGYAKELERTRVGRFILENVYSL